MNNSSKFKAIYLAAILGLPSWGAATEPQIEFRGIPKRVKSVGFDLPCDKAISKKEGTEMQCVIHKIGDRYYWTSKNNREVQKVLSGYFTDYLCLSGCGYLRVTNTESELNVALMGNSESEYDYVEYDFLGLKAIVYYGIKSK